MCTNTNYDYKVINGWGWLSDSKWGKSSLCEQFRESTSNLYHTIIHIRMGKRWNRFPILWSKKFFTIWDLWFYTLSAGLLYFGSDGRWREGNRWNNKWTKHKNKTSPCFEGRNKFKDQNKTPSVRIYCFLFIVATLSRVRVELSIEYH